MGREQKNFEKLKVMDHEDIRALYEQYSEWSRHLHSEILTIATFGLTLSLGSLSLVANPETDETQFVIVGIASLLLLLACHYFAESVRNQQLNFWAVLNHIEAFWKIRDSETNENGPLIQASKKYRPGSTRNQRRNLYIITGLIWIAAIFSKLLGRF